MSVQAKGKKKEKIKRGNSQLGIFGLERTGCGNSGYPARLEAVHAPPSSCP